MPGAGAFPGLTVRIKQSQAGCHPLGGGHLFHGRQPRVGCKGSAAGCPLRDAVRMDGEERCHDHRYPQPADTCRLASAASLRGKYGHLIRRLAPTRSARASCPGCRGLPGATISGATSAATWATCRPGYSQAHAVRRTEAQAALPRTTSRPCGWWDPNGAARWRGRQPPALDAGNGRCNETGPPYSIRLC